MTQSICKSDDIKAQYLADGGSEENWGWDLWGMIAASMKVNGVYDECAQRQQINKSDNNCTGIYSDSCPPPIKEQFDAMADYAWKLAQIGERDD